MTARREISMEAYGLVPGYCTHCKWHRKLSTPHLAECPAWADKPACHEIHGSGLWVGAAEARADSRFVAVVGILCADSRRRMGDKVPLPKVPYLLLDHPDREFGLLDKAPTAWDFMDEHLRRGPMLVHCHAGASRSPAVVAGWMMTRRHEVPAGSSRLRARVAVQRLTDQRPPAMFLWPGFCEELLQLERDLARKNKVARQRAGD